MTGARPRPGTQPGTGRGLRPSGQLARRKGLPQGGELSRGAGLKRTKGLPARSPLAEGKMPTYTGGLKRTPLQPSAKPVRARSRKMEAAYVLRRPLVAELLALFPNCQVPGCRRRSTDVHEVLSRARGGSILDRANCRCICRHHHRVITDDEPEWAYRLGFLVHSWEQTPSPPPGPANTSTEEAA